MYDKLVTKVNNIDNSEFVLKTKCETDKPNMPNISLLATTSALTAVQNKIPDLSSLVKKTDYNAKISEIEKKVTDHNHDKYITTPEFNGSCLKRDEVTFNHGTIVNI